MMFTGKGKWILGLVAISCLVLLSNSYAGLSDFGAGPPESAGRSPVASFAQATGPAVHKAYRYQYFPDVQVYFDPSRELFFYMMNGEWTKSPGLPRSLRDRLGDFVIIEMDSDDPYDYYMESTRKQMPPAGPQEEVGRIKTSGGSPPSLPYRYFYYPRDQVYFNPDNNTYFYFLEGRWHRSQHLPGQIREPGGDYVIIETDTDMPYTYHGQVLQMVFRQAKEPKGLESGPLPWEPSRGDPVYRYLYYPAAFVYFDEDRRTYFYFTHDQWLDSSSLPSYLANNLGNPVQLRMNTPQPYQYHAQVIERYPHPGAAVNRSNPIFQIWSGKY